MLRLRVLSAVIGVPVLLFVAIAGGWWFVVAVTAGATVAIFEMFSMLRGAGYRPLMPLGIGLTMALVLDALAHDAAIMPAILVVGVLIGLYQMMLRPDSSGALVDWALTLAPAIYVGGTMHYFIQLRNLPDGLFWMLTALIGTWICDIAAFFVGRRWGKARLAPRISPGKSVEGAVGGLVGAVLGIMALGPMLGGALATFGLGGPAVVGPVRLAGLGLVIGVCAIVGDLMESFIKRQCGAKDSSGLIPGHGGVLDRIDSVLLAVVGAYFYVVTTS
ncbi:MAG: phosphatidate cytidylyltransferase [Chloroflexi bacterium]|nr:phosphatidate cytidylyltransferase [Chloroflexota bacterium]